MANEMKEIDAYDQIKNILEKARERAYRNVNFLMVQAYWNIGRVIVEHEQKGEEKAAYGRYLIIELAKKLTDEFGKGFDERNLRYMREFYLNFKIRNSLRSELSWTHYRLILRLEDKNARNFYMVECANSRWSTRELDRQISSLLYERLCLSKDKKSIMILAKKGQILNQPKDLIKDPLVLEFLDMGRNDSFLEKDLEKSILDKLYSFLLELGKGYSFVDRQYRINIDSDNYYVDLVFYNFILKCFVLVDLKIGKLTPHDIGQMDFYVRYFEKEVRRKEDNPTLGIILCSDRNKTMIRYTLLEEEKHIFASKYRLYVPSLDEIRKSIE